MIGGGLRPTLINSTARFCDGAIAKPKIDSSQNLGKPMARYFATCPNCGLTDKNGLIYSCSAEHHFCERCAGRKMTPVLKLRVDVCPICESEDFAASGLLAAASKT
jgi:hypothetical protein